MAALAGIDDVGDFTLRRLNWRAQGRWKQRGFELAWLCAHYPRHSRRTPKLDDFNPAKPRTPDISEAEFKKLREDVKLPATLTEEQVEARWRAFQRSKAA